LRIALYRKKRKEKQEKLKKGLPKDKVCDSIREEKVLFFHYLILNE
jgi:hypothetical protein